MAKSAVFAARHKHHNWVGFFTAWARQHRLVLDVILGGILTIAAGSVIAQLSYPADRALPFMHIGGLDVSTKNRGAVLAQLSDYAEYGEVTVKTPSREWKTKWQEIGLSIDRDASAEAALHYPIWERLIPFSSIMRIMQSREMPLIALADDERLRAFAEKLVAEDKLAARDATISIKDGSVYMDDAKNGYKFTVTEVQRQVESIPMTNHSVLGLVPDAVPFVRSKAELQAVAAEAEKMLSRPLTLVVADKTFKPDRKVIGTWLRFVEDDKKKLVVAFDEAALKKYLEQIDHEVKIAPGVITVTLLDGQEIAQTQAQPGRTVAVDAAVWAIEQQLRSQSAPQELKLGVASVPPEKHYVRTYSQESSGLQALIRDWEAATYGTYGIVVRELTGVHRYADWQPDRPFVTSSTYKMFLAYTVFTKIGRGEISFGQRTDMGWTVDECIREMIVNSTNPCAISLQNMVGWETVDQMVHEAGFTATNLNNRGGGDKYSTVRDETNFLMRLQAGTLMSSEHTDYLMGLLKRQIWRGGIPSGVPRGTVVANKVGFYDGWVHDVAIVYGPKSTYILGIMSRGGSDPKFADLSRRVYNFFNQ